MTKDILDEILVRLYLGEKFWEEYHDNPIVIAKQMEDGKPARAKKAINKHYIKRSEVLELIGEDEKRPTHLTPDTKEMGAYTRLIRNKLRAELRASITKEEG
jgi:hypothetical protein